MFNIYQADKLKVERNHDDSKAHLKKVYEKRAKGKFALITITHYRLGQKIRGKNRPICKKYDGLAFCCSRF